MNINKNDLKFLPKETSNPYTDISKISEKITPPKYNTNTDINDIKTVNKPIVKKPNKIESTPKNNRMNRISYGEHSLYVILLGTAFPPLLIIGSVWLVIVAVRRFHDLNKSGMNIFFLIIPIIGIFVHFYLLFTKGDEGENNYGLPTENDGMFSVISYFVHIVLLILTLLALFVFLAGQ